jgi:hypothetical protein
MARVLIYTEVVFLVLLSAASLTDARIATLPVYLSPALVVGFFFCNLAISGSILWSNSPLCADRIPRRGHERLWSVLAAWILGAATMFAMLPLVS